jgi:hypothetical protein
MIIALAAPPIVDVSRTADVLAKRHGLAVHPDPTRQVVEGFGFQTLYDMPEGLQRQVREGLIRDHLALVTRQGGLVLEYSVFNWLADWMRWFWNRTPTEAWEQVMRQAAAVAERYDVVYHVETGPDKSYDGFVWRDRHNARQINSLLKSLYSDLNLGPKLRSGGSESLRA